MSTHYHIDTHRTVIDGQRQLDAYEVAGYLETPGAAFGCVSTDQDCVVDL